MSQRAWLWCVAVVLTGLIVVTGCEQAQKAEEEMPPAEAEEEAAPTQPTSGPVPRAADLEPMALSIALEERLPPTVPLRVEWTLPLKSGQRVTNLWVPPEEAGVDFLLVLTEANDLIAVRREDGRALWWAQLEQTPATPPACSPFGVYFVSGGDLIHLEVETGRAIWQLPLSFPAGDYLQVTEAQRGTPHFIIQGLTRVVRGVSAYSSMWPPPRGYGSLDRKDLMMESYHLREDWKFGAKGSVIGPVGAGRGGALVVADDAGWIYGANRGYIVKGRPNIDWREQTKGPNVAGVGLHEPYAVVPSRDRVIYCLRMGDGATAWRYPTGELMDEQPVFVEHPATGRISVFVRCKGGPVLCLGLDDGKLKWQVDEAATVIAMGEDPERPEGEQVTVVLRLPDGSLESRALQGGQRRWQVPSGFLDLAAEAPARSMIFGVHEGDTLCALVQE